MKYLINLLVTAVSAYLLTYVLSGVQITSFKAAIIFAFVLGLLNTFVKPILSLFALPVTIVTLGLFSLVVNAVVIMIADYFLDSITITSFWWAFLFSIALSLLTSFIHSFIDDKKK